MNLKPLLFLEESVVFSVVEVVVSRILLEINLGFCNFLILHKLNVKQLTGFNMLCHFIIS